jgi:hypothetical protein
MPDFVITKSNGDQELFNSQKLVQSLKRSQASDSEIEQVLAHVSSKLRNGMTTGEIYSIAHKALTAKQNKNPNAIRYALKQSVMDLGPSGFPFELFVARIFAELGYMCQTGVMVQGHCIEHEVDVLAHKGDEVICIEAKFHNEPYLKSDTKVALYVKARFDDLMGQKIYVDGTYKHVTKGILITNTNFTDNAKAYVSCVNTFDLISWNHPQGMSLLNYIEKYSLHPITAIPELSKSDVTRLIEQGIIMCSDVKDHPAVLDRLNIKKSKQESIFETIDLICKNKMI